MIKGNLDGVLPEVVAELTKLDVLVEGDIIVTSAFRQGDTGEHGKGLAVDVIAPSYEGRLLDFYLVAERLAWKGIGLYPTWDNDQKGIKCGGLHLDLRSGPAARWMGLGSGKNQLYTGLNQENLRKHGVI